MFISSKCKTFLWSSRNSKLEGCVKAQRVSICKEQIFCVYMLARVNLFVLSIYLSEIFPKSMTYL